LSQHGRGLEKVYDMDTRLENTRKAVTVITIDESEKHKALIDESTSTGWKRTMSTASF
jgi:hypothetical protein